MWNTVEVFDFCFKIFINVVDKNDKKIIMMFDLIELWWTLYQTISDYSFYAHIGH